MVTRTARSYTVASFLKTEREIRPPTTSGTVRDGMLRQIGRAGYQAVRFKPEHLATGFLVVRNLLVQRSACIPLPNVPLPLPREAGTRNGMFG